MTLKTPTIRIIQHWCYRRTGYSSSTTLVYTKSSSRKSCTVAIYLRIYAQLGRDGFSNILSPYRKHRNHWELCYRRIEYLISSESSLIEINSTTIAGICFVVIHLPIRAHRHLVRADSSNIWIVHIGSIVATIALLFLVMISLHWPWIMLHIFLHHQPVSKARYMSIW